MVVPAGTAIMVRVEDIHHNPQIYPNPTVFNPDNFSPEAVSQRSKCSFLAFGTGSRDCIGKKKLIMRKGSKKKFWWFSHINQKYTIFR